jgi:putative ABC transport system ATP-binding protein
MRFRVAPIASARRRAPDQDPSHRQKRRRSHRASSDRGTAGAAGDPTQGQARTAARQCSLLEVEELCFEIGGLQVLHRVSFTLERGELAVITGASGTGKTTLLKCLNRLVEPCSGRIALSGMDTAGISPVELRRRIGMVWQTPFMFEGSVGENLRRAARFIGTSIDDEACSRLLERVAFDRALDADARTLSVGQQQRVAVARALVGRPQLLLCDEPTASLDRETSLRLESTLREMCADGMTIVFVTHDAAQADRIADRTLLLERRALTEIAARLPAPTITGRP